MDPKDINERRRGDLDKFLTTTNTKAAVFRDIIIESGVTAVDSGPGLRVGRELIRFRPCSPLVLDVAGACVSVEVIG